MAKRSDRSRYPMRKLRLGDPDPRAPAGATPEECIGMMWELTRNTWAFMGHADAEPRLQRHLIRVVSRGR